MLFLLKEQRETPAKKKKVKLHSVSFSQFYILMVQPPNEILQHGALPCTLTADDRYLRQVQVAGLADRAEGVLELVDEGNQVFHSPVSHSCSSVSSVGFILLSSTVKQEPRGSLVQQTKSSRMAVQSVTGSGSLFQYDTRELRVRSPTSL